MSFYIFGDDTKKITFDAPGMSSYVPDVETDVVYSATFPVGGSRREVNKAMRGIAALLCGRGLAPKAAENSFFLGSTETVTVVVGTAKAIERMDRFVDLHSKPKGVVWTRSAPVVPAKKPVNNRVLAPAPANV